jgi:hypothetical protein
VADHADAASPVVSPKFAYLLLTHKQAVHVEELADRILGLSATGEIAVHHDARSESVPWQGQPPGRSHLVAARHVEWGDWSMVEATLTLLRFGVNELGADWLVLLSGEHRPLVDLARWEEGVARSGVDALAPAVELPARLHFGRAEVEANTYLSRSRHRWHLQAWPRSAALRRVMDGVVKMGRALSPLGAIEYIHRRESWAIGLRRPLGPLEGHRLFRGSQWIAVNRRAAQTVLETDPAVTDWFTRSWIPDESYFHTVLRAAGGLVVRNAATTFVLDTPARPTPGWMRLTLDDLPAAWAAATPFARKVDPDERPEVIAAIDRAVDGHRAGEPAPPSHAH